MGLDVKTQMKSCFVDTAVGPKSLQRSVFPNHLAAKYPSREKIQQTFFRYFVSQLSFAADEKFCYVFLILG